jgi:hypothetical protein
VERKINSEVCHLDCDTVAYSSRRFEGHSAFIFRVRLFNKAQVFGSISARVSDVLLVRTRSGARDARK